MSLRNTLMVISLALSVVIGLVLSRGGVDPAKASSPTKGAVVIGLSLDTLKEARWQADRDLFVGRASELGATVLVQSANSEDTRQMQDVTALISRGVKVLVIVPHDATTMAKAVDAAHKANIPVMAYDRLIRDCDLDLYMSFDAIHVGELQAKYLLEHLPTPGKGRIVRVYGAPSDNNAKLFKEGQDAVLKPYIERGDIKVVHEDWAEDWKPENGKKIVNAAITNLGGKFDAVLATNDGTAGGAIQALTEEGLSGKILVTGQDAELAAVQRIAAGTQTMTIYKPLKKLALAAAETAVKMATGGVIVARSSTPNGKIDVPSVLADVIPVDKGNLVESIVKDGFHSYDDVFRGVPESQRPRRPTP
jgi:D-xylose transport system substrate-binding protein